MEQINSEDTMFISVYTPTDHSHIVLTGVLSMDGQCG